MMSAKTDSRTADWTHDMIRVRGRGRFLVEVLQPAVMTLRVPIRAIPPEAYSAFQAAVKNSVHDSGTVTVRYFPITRSYNYSSNEYQLPVRSETEAEIEVDWETQPVPPHEQHPTVNVFDLRAREPKIYDQISASRAAELRIWSGDRFDVVAKKD